MPGQNQIARFRLPDRVQQAIALLLKIFHDRAEVNRLIRESAIFRDFGLIQHFESVALEQFEPASAIECYHLRMDLFDAMIVQVTKVGLQKLPSDLDRLSCWKEIDVKMSDGPRRRGNLAPGFRNQPLNVFSRFRFITEIAADDSSAVNKVLKEAVNLVPQRMARSEEISLQDGVFCQHERGIRFVLQIIIREEIREQRAIFKDRVYRVSQEAGFATECPYRVPIGRAIVADLKVFDLEHSRFHAGVAILGFKKTTSAADYTVEERRAQYLSFLSDAPCRRRIVQTRIF
jgi:hypothetical protein